MILKEKLPASLAVGVMWHNRKDDSCRRPKQVDHLFVGHCDHIAAADSDETAECLDSGSVGRTPRLHVGNNSIATDVKAQLTGTTSRDRHIHRLQTYTHTEPCNCQFPSRPRLADD